MELEKFRKVIKSMQDYDKEIEYLEKAGISIIESKINDAVMVFHHEMLAEVFGQDGWETIEWWLYEVSPLIARDEYEDMMWDENNNVIPMKTVDDLYNYLIKN